MNYRWQVRKSPYGYGWWSYQRNVAAVPRPDGTWLMADLTTHDTHAEAMTATCTKIRKHGKR